jgi:glycosyltransferase involved in cell wall biosynthesis
MTTSEQQNPMTAGQAAVQGAAPDVAVVIPVKDEAGNIGPLIDEIGRELAGSAFEVVCVDDGSSDGTTEELAAVKRRSPWLTVVRHRSACGQSTATRTGVRAARAEWIVTIDGDGQNPPGEIRKLIAARDAAAGTIAMVAGQRERRNDSWFRRLSSRIANGVRQWLLNDGIRDTGCSLKLFRRQTFLDLPYFDHMHRFLPALVQRQGGTVITTPVAHRARVHGESKYGFHNRLWPGIVDLAGVLWLKRRARIPHIEKTD